jgi:hypothetical protein
MTKRLTLNLGDPKFITGLLAGAIFLADSGVGAHRV